jgi:hypothetical protein
MKTFKGNFAGMAILNASALAWIIRRDGGPAL